MSRIASVLSSVFRLGSGEVLSRFSSFLLLAYLSRRYDVEMLGVLALAQAAAMYVTIGTDQGLKWIGARIVATDPGAAHAVIRELIRKRLISCVVCVLLGLAYGFFGPMPSVARPYVLAFVVAVVPYSFSLDWLAWGLDRLGWLGAWRALVSFSFAEEQSCLR